MMQLIESQDTLLNTVRLINNLILAAIFIWMIHTSLIYFICYSTNVISNHNHPNNSHTSFFGLNLSRSRNNATVRDLYSTIHPIKSLTATREDQGTTTSSGNYSHIKNPNRPTEVSEPNCV